jgi:SPX domain protein involved in polyphosphate accumulation
MKFGKDFRNHLEETLPAWRDKYLAYKALKKLIKNLRPAEPPLPPPPPPAAEGPGGGAAAQGNVALGNWFARILDMELHKLNEFYMEREEWYVIRLQVRAAPSPRPRHRPRPPPISAILVHACMVAPYSGPLS